MDRQELIETFRGLRAADPPVFGHFAVLERHRKEGKRAEAHVLFALADGHPRRALVHEDRLHRRGARSLVARARKGLPLEHDPIGVAVLQMIRPKAAGIMFTAEPTTADSSKLVIEGTWGLGESVVSGAVIPDYWVVNKTMLEIVERRVSPKPAKHNLHLETAKALSSNTIHDRQEGCLSDEEVIELTKRGKSIEEYFGSPQDVEWALASDLPGDSIVILQTRPEHFRVSFAGF